MLEWLSFLVACATFLPDSVRSEPLVPCFFVFGDSLVDSGNNNVIASMARANYAPYGIDFPYGPTGRFSNGLTTVDVIAQLLGFENYILPYSQASGTNILSGVNYASAAAGIRSETGQQLGARIDFDGQLSNYKNTVSQLVNMLGGEEAAAQHLSQCIYYVGIGSNDYLNNYFMPESYSTSSRFTPEQYADALADQYRQQLKTLYRYGARKVVVIGVGLVGCSPNKLASGSNDGVTCVGKINNAIRFLNKRLTSLVADFNNQLEGSKFTLIDTFNMLGDVLQDPRAHGFTNSNSGCCGVGRNRGQITCLPLQIPCANRNQYLFWDAFHPTEAANILFGKMSYIDESNKYCRPFDIRTLALL